MVLLFALANAACAPTAEPTLVVTPSFDATDARLVDERLELRVTGLEGAQQFTVRSTTLDQRERPWVAEAAFVADAEGRADLASAVPLAGSSYEAADGMGLFWAAAPPEEGAQIAPRPGIVFETRLELIVDGEVVDEHRLERRFDAPGTQRLDVREDGLVATYLRPEGDGPFPAVVVFAGSDGGIESAEWRAHLLAGRGFAALAVAYFGYEERPADLVEIPLEYGASAVDWLDARPETGRVAVLGFSKGSEFALNLAARKPTIAAAVAISFSGYVWPGISDGPPETRSSWTWQGEPLPNIPWSVGPRAGAMFAQGPPFQLRLLYVESLEAASPETLAAASIPIEEIAGPVLLVSGEVDGSWPASDMGRRLEERMVAAGRASDVTHLAYPEAGHLLFWDYLPATGAERTAGQVFGGAIPATAAARADSWPRIQDFLHAALSESG